MQNCNAYANWQYWHESKCAIVYFSVYQSFASGSELRALTAWRKKLLQCLAVTVRFCGTVCQTAGGGTVSMRSAKCPLLFCLCDGRCASCRIGRLERGRPQWYCLLSSLFSAKTFVKWCTLVQFLYLWCSRKKADFLKLL